LNEWFPDLHHQALNSSANWRRLLSAVTKRAATPTCGIAVDADKAADSSVM